MTIDDLSDRQILGKLREFSRTEHTEENLDFLAKVSEYRKSGGERMLAEAIMVEFIKVPTSGVCICAPEGGADFYSTTRFCSANARFATAQALAPVTLGSP